MYAGVRVGGGEGCYMGGGKGVKRGQNQVPMEVAKKNNEYPKC